MSDMKCPFCGKELEQYWYEDFECWYCPDIDCKGYAMTATDDMWQELIRTKKQLDRALWWLHEIVENHRCTPISTAEMALQELEQKEVK